MRLNDDQLHSLVQLLTPRFKSVQDRRAALEQVASGDGVLLNLPDLDQTPENFTTTLIDELGKKESRTSSGESALARLLASLADKSGNKAFNRSLQPYIKQLTEPGEASENAAPPPVIPTTRMDLSAGIDYGPDQKRHSRRRRKRGPIRRVVHQVRRALKWQIILAVLLVITIVPTALITALATDAGARVQESITGLKRVLNGLNGRSFTQFSRDDFDRLQFSVDDLGKSLDRAAAQTRLLRPVASLRSDISAALDAMDTATEVVQAAQDMLTGLEPTMFFLIQGEKDKMSLQLSAGERVVELLRVGQGRFLSANSHLERAAEKLKVLDFTGLSPTFLLSAQELVKYQSQLQDLNQILLDGPDLLTQAFGIAEPEDYLILAMNSDELRPSGGYISTWGWMRVRRVRISDYGYSPTTPLSPNPPPEEMVTDLNIPSWWIQYQHPIYAAFDGSWYADFSSTAKMAAWFYDNGENPRSPVAGVVGIDLFGFEYMLRGLGKVTVPGYNEDVTAENFREMIYRIREGGGDAPHKRFLSALYKQILSDWQAVSQERSDRVFAGMLRALQEKHIMLYFKDEKLSRAVNMLGWSGVQVPARDHDFLMVADANLGSKSNRSVVRQLTYDVEIQADGTLKSRATVAYDFSAFVAAKDPAFNPANYTNINYFSIMQVFLPAGVTVTGTNNLQNNVDTVTDDDHTTLVTQTEVRYDSTERYQFLYTTPKLVEAFGPYHRYRLLLQKQPGMSGESVNVQVTLPPNATVVSASPDPAASYNLGQQVLEFRVQLQTDKWIEIVYTD